MSQDFGHGVFHISGGPGSGKSTIMKSILQKLDKRYTVASFFFYNLGVTLQKSREGLLRALLFQILQKNNTLLSHVLPEYRKLKGQIRWHPNILQKLLLEILADSSRPPIFFVIDALDECQEDISELLDSIAVIKNLMICVSSRPDSRFPWHNPSGDDVLHIGS